jgi:hypothetical protein
MFSMIPLKIPGMAGKANSSFWQDLGGRFCAIQGTHGMRGDKDYIVGSGEPAKWTLKGSTSLRAGTQLKALANRGASGLPHAPGSDLLCVWLEAVSCESANFKWDDREGIEADDGSEGAHHLTGTLWNICQASADYCAEMESKALEVEALDDEVGRLGSAPDPNEETPEPVEQVTTEPERGLPNKTFATALGRNLDRLRREVGWSYNEMAKATEIDKTLILGHVNKGKNASAGTLATYASAFSDKLGRAVTVAELEA